MGESKLLVCLFTYNRASFLRNAARSIDRFFPFGDRLVIDDGSSDPAVGVVLDEIRGWRNWRVQVMERRPDRHYGGFYRNMHFALRTALDEGYDYCFFFEDDEQLVWRKDDYPQYLDRFFARCPDAIMLQPLFLRRVVSYADIIEYVSPGQAYRSNRGFTTTGFWNLARVRQFPDYDFKCEFGDDLPSNSAYWMSKGFRLYLEAYPTVAVLPWVKSQFDNPGQDGRGEASADDFLLTPLSPGEIAGLTNRPPSLPPYQEYFDLSRDNCDRPIWHQAGKMLSRYYELCKATVAEEDRLGASPPRIPVHDRWVPTRIPPLASHLSWEQRRRSLAATPAAKSPAGLLLDRLAPPSLAARLRRLREFSLSDYLAYRELSRRLARERQAFRAGISAGSA